VYAFVRQPKWIFAHLLTGLLLTLFIFAGFWQLERHDKRVKLNNTITTQIESKTLPLETFSSTETKRLEYRIFQGQGSWMPEDAVLIRNRSYQELSGCHLAVPLMVQPQEAIVVIVGWLQDTECVSPNPFVPKGKVVLTARARLTQKRGAIGPKDAENGQLESMARVDVARIDKQTSINLAPHYLELINAEPIVENVFLLEPPLTNNGPHLAYAIQWLLFFGVGIIGYPLFLRRQAIHGENESLDN
jgi:cytochrome oxidase assembly protein ShyY1